MGTGGIYASFIAQRQELLAQTDDPALRQHYRDEIALVESWDTGDIDFGNPDYVAPAPSPPPRPIPGVAARAAVDAPAGSPPAGRAPAAGFIDYGTNPYGYANGWNTVRFGNTQNEPITVHVTVGAGQSLPAGVDANGDFTIPPGGHVDLTFAPGTSVNFRSTKGDGSVWNQGELYFDAGSHIIWGDMSYIYGANSNMRIFSSDGQHSGYLGDILSAAPQDVRVGDWGIAAPYDRFEASDDPNDPDSAAGGPDGPRNRAAAYLYGVLAKGEGYVDRGRPVEVSDYDDASSLRFSGQVAVVF